MATWKYGLQVIDLPNCLGQKSTFIIYHLSTTILHSVVNLHKELVSSLRLGKLNLCEKNFFSFMIDCCSFSTKLKKNILLYFLSMTWWDWSAIFDLHICPSTYMRVSCDLDIHALRCHVTFASFLYRYFINFENIVFHEF